VQVGGWSGFPFTPENEEGLVCILVLFLELWFEKWHQHLLG
jgi:hypothetical protein